MSLERALASIPPCSHPRQCEDARKDAETDARKDATMLAGVRAL
jgi:hypothetical protein